MKQICKYFKDTFSWKSDSKTPAEFTIIKNRVRLSLITDRLLRVEIDKKGNYTDEPTQSIICRNFAKPEYKIVPDGDVLIIITPKTIFKYDTKKEEMSKFEKLMDKLGDISEEELDKLLNEKLTEADSGDNIIMFSAI